MDDIVMSTLPKTWIFDLDGTLVKHNGYKIDGHDTLLDGVKEYIDSIPESDRIVMLTSRTDEYKEATLRFLADNDIRFDIEERNTAETSNFLNDRSRLIIVSLWH